MLRRMIEIEAKQNAEGLRTGWAHWGDVEVAFYPVSGTFNWFLRGEGKVTAKRLDMYLKRQVREARANE